jgi:RND superfamily putative drug exporter
VRRLPLVGRAMRAFGDVAPPEGAFSKLCRVTQRYPALTVWIVLAVLLVSALPVLRMDIVNSAAGHLPKGQEQRELFEELQRDFSFASVPPITVLAASPVEGVDGLVRAIEATPGVIRVDPPRQQTDGWRTVTVLAVRVAASDSSNPAAEVVERIRILNPPYRMWLTGQAVVTVDYVADLRSRAWLAATIVVLATFVLLFLMTGSVLVPVKALLMNVVSLGATLGIVVWGFQDGALEGLLGFSSVGGVETFVPPIVLAFGFGLAMDYEVFLLARIAENRERGQSNGDAVAAGLQGSGRIITSAALILVVVFIGLLTGRVLMVKETGLALAASVVVDASLVRMLLVPATMTLLGEWNWWAPAPLRRLHERFGLEEHRPAPHAVALTRPPPTEAPSVGQPAVTDASEPPFAPHSTR